MSTTSSQVALWIELLAAELGGSLLRDIVLNQPPVVVWKNW